MSEGKYSRKNLYEGAIFDSNYCGKFKILSKVKMIFDETGLHNAPYSYDPKYCVQFLDTGFVTYASRIAILSGKVKDRLVPEVANVGYIGSNIKITDPKYFTFYRSWNDMLNRCYNTADKSYENYGAKGVSVDNRWFNFWNFFNDIHEIKNYELKLKFPNEFALDKDFLQFGKPRFQKIYSKSTCIFVSNFDNSQIMNRERTKTLGNDYFGVTVNRDPKNPNRIISYSANVTIFNHSTLKLGKRNLANFKDPISAANLFNYVFPFITKDIPFHQINILNNVPQIPYNELKKNVFKNLPNNWFNDYPDWEYIASAMEAAGDRFAYIYW